jgi:hypothetical protein
MKFTLPVVALVAALGASGAVRAPSAAAQDAAAQAQPQAAQPQAPARPAPQRFEPGRHIEGRIAFLRAELKITPQQGADWDKVAQAMRDNARETHSTFEQARANRGQAQSAVARLEMRQRFETLRAQQSQRFLAAFRPLYASLSGDQKKAADELFAPHWRHHHGA